MRFIANCKPAALALSVAMAVGTTPVMAGGGHAHDKVFNRIATFPVYLNTDIDAETIAEIVDVSKDGMTLVYTDGEMQNIGFVDITNPHQPKADGIVGVGGEPTSVAVAGDYALVAVNTSPSFVTPSGNLLVVDMKTRAIVATHPLGGQPDSVAVSPNGRYAALVIENERDEDLGDGEPPQAPGGGLIIVDLVGAPTDWTLRTVSFAGVPELFPNDPEPEYVDINRKNIAVVTFQENNHLALVDLKTGSILNHFSAGTADLTQIDTKEEDPALINLSDTQNAVAREPDGVAWINRKLFATADEGDLFGGSRGVTVFNTLGEVVFSSGNSLEHEVARLGHYPDDRSKNKGNEPENVDVARFGADRYIFVASERASVIFVYEILRNGKGFKLTQTLPAGVGPEGVKAIPQRKLLVSAGENDSRGDGYRAVLTLYQLQKAEQAYPTVVSAKRPDGTPIPWAALSGLAMDRDDDHKAYTIHDSYFQKSRIYALDVGEHPAVITAEIVLKDSMGKLAAVDAGMVNGDGTVNLDPEGIATSAKGGFWLASEGAGTQGDAQRPFETYNLLLHVSEGGDIDEVVTLPASTNARQVRFGFEGVAAVGSALDEVLYVAFQREWADDDAGMVRIGRYETAAGEWSFYYYPLDPRESPNGGWVGLSEISALGNDEFAVIERDNQANTDARI